MLSQMKMLAYCSSIIKLMDIKNVEKSMEIVGINKIDIFQFEHWSQ